MRFFFKQSLLVVLNRFAMSAHYYINRETEL